MVPNYPTLFREEVSDLQSRERATRDKLAADRLRLLRFLKEGRVAGVSPAARRLGYSVRTVQRWWQRYRAGGLAALLPPPRPRGARERITAPAWDGLRAEMHAGRIGGLHEAQLYLRRSWGIECGIDAISKLFVAVGWIRLEARVARIPPAIRRRLAGWIRLEDENGSV